MKRLRNYTLVFLIGLMAGSTGMYWYHLPAAGGEDPGVTVTRLTGERIAHHDIKVNRNSITFRTTAEGKGEALTEIPKRLVPEAREWMDKVNAVQVTASQEFYDGFFPEYGVMYWRRFGWISTGAGVRGSARSAALEAGVMVWF